MASIFSKNGILTGRIDHYCLICAEHFKNEDESLAHVSDAQHKANLDSCGYFEKYKEDFIRKTKGIYFCEPCSLTLPTATKVELHLDDPSHAQEKRKNSPWLLRGKNDIIAFNQYIITDDAWNGCVEDTCVLCNTEFDDSSSHKGFKTHVLNLIKSEVVFDQDKKTVYRAIDAKSMQCLTCNVIFGTEATNHFTTVEHKDAYKLYDPSIQEMEPKNKSPTPSKNVETAEETQNGKPENEKDDSNNSIEVINGEDPEAASKNADFFKKVTSPKKDTKKEASKGLEQGKLNENPKKSPKKESVKANIPLKTVNEKIGRKITPEDLDRVFCKNLGAVDYIVKADDCTWCIICEFILEEPADVHISSKHHQYILKLHRGRLAQKVSCEKHEKITRCFPYDVVERYEEQNIELDLIKEKAFCKKCSKSIDFDTNAIEKHIKDHDKPCVKKSPETLSSGIKSDGTDKTTLYTKPVLLNKDKPKPVSVEEYAKQHGFSHNRADNSYYCRPCSRRLPTTLDDLEKHVASKIHTENTKAIAKLDTNKAPAKGPIIELIQSYEFVRTDQEDILVINGKYWLNSFGFFLIARMNERIFCHGCYIDLISDNVMEHILLNPNHRGILEKCLLINSLDGEFIREIKLDVYHCGFCNIKECDWDDMLDHIATSEHQTEKAKSEDKIRRHRSNPTFKRTVVKEVSVILKEFARRNCM